MKYAILSALIISFALPALANPRENFYSRIVSGQELAYAATHSEYTPRPIDKYFFYAIVQREPRGLAMEHSGFNAQGARYEFLERVIEGQTWENASRYTEYVPTPRERFFLLLRSGSGLRSASDNSNHIPNKADMYYYKLLHEGRSPRQASEDTNFTPGRSATVSFTSAYWFGLPPRR